MENNTPKIKPLKHIEYEFKQSKYGDIVPKLPTRSLVLAPSFSGKTVLLQNLILDVYRGCFERIYIFSPTIELDTTWRPVKDYIEKEIKPNKKERIYFDGYDPEELENIVKKQFNVVNYMKQNNHKKLYSILIILDDMAEEKDFLKHNKLLHALYTKGRHMGISTIISTQVYKSVAPTIRKNATNLIVFKLRNQGDMDALLEELTAISDRKTIQKYII